MIATKESHTGGCQCGAVRFRVTELGRPSFCHCRMCQKAFGATGGALVTAKAFTWTRGAPKYFQSSKAIKRGFCADCGTPLTFEYEGGIDIAIPTFDKAGEIAPVIQLSPEAALPWAAGISSLPGYPAEERERREAWMQSIQSNQHPDHDTDVWPAKVWPSKS
ncbi:MAG: GFA family protein [Hyphomicrobiaceae bacterium]|nr:GFA family protein [Hyphomicrobiaceae bacterium]